MIIKISPCQLFYCLLITLNDFYRISLGKYSCVNHFLVKEFTHFNNKTIWQSKSWKSNFFRLAQIKTKTKMVLSDFRMFVWFFLSDIMSSHLIHMWFWESEIGSLHFMNAFRHPIIWSIIVWIHAHCVFIIENSCRYWFDL